MQTLHHIVICFVIFAVIRIMYSGDCLLSSFGKSTRMNCPEESRAAGLRVGGKDDTTGRPNLGSLFSAAKGAPLKTIVLL